MRHLSAANRCLAVSLAAGLSSQSAHASLLHRLHAVAVATMTSPLAAAEVADVVVAVAPPSPAVDAVALLAALRGFAEGELSIPEESDPPRTSPTSFQHRNHVPVVATGAAVAP